MWAVSCRGRGSASESPSRSRARLFAAAQALVVVFRARTIPNSRTLRALLRPFTAKRCSSSTICTLIILLYVIPHMNSFFFVTCPFFPQRYLVFFFKIHFLQLTTADIFWDFFTSRNISVPSLAGSSFSSAAPVGLGCGLFCDVAKRNS